MSESTSLDAKAIVKDLPKAILNWYSFKGDETVLFLGEKNTAVCELLQEKCGKVSCANITEIPEKTCFDIIVLIKTIECIKSPTEELKKLKKSLKPQGKLLIATDNRLGIRFFCGDRDPYTQRNFDGVENYRRAHDVVSNTQFGRCYSKNELCDILCEAEFTQYKFYSVYPNLDMPQLVYADGITPNEEISCRYFPRYNHPNTVFLEEEYLLKDLIENGMFHSMANSFLVEVTLEDDFVPIDSVTVSMERGRQKSIATIIYSDKTVEKRMLYHEGAERLKNLYYNSKDLSARGLNVILGDLENLSYTMPYIEGESYVSYLQKLFVVDINAFIIAIDNFRELLLTSSEHSLNHETQDIILKKGYIDLVPLNCIIKDNILYFFDQEEYIEDCPLNAILLRVIHISYNGNIKMLRELPVEFFYKRYDMERRLDEYRKIEWGFLDNLRNLRELAPHMRKFERNYNIVNSNRLKLNYSSGEYQNIFIDVFRDIGNQKLVLFGSGNFAKRFLGLYSKDYRIECIVDNNSDKWDTELEGYHIVGPDNLKHFSSGGYRIIICIKNYLGVTRQLEDLKIKNYCIYDPNVSYDRKIPTVNAGFTKTSKKYNIGYVAGVFDLFHVGHLNLLKRAKEQCNHLIVGVVSDDGVRNHKNTEPYIPFEERLEIVASCKYVDEAVEIPLNFGGTEEAYNLYKFDAQFSGSDYTNDVNWLTQKAYLESQGAELVFFPYTESTSSSKLKHAIDEKTK